MSAKATRQQFFQEHPTCCFCGGERAATTRDHVPPRACFPKQLMPEGFEFPSCQACNYGSAKQDTIFGFATQLLDLNEANRTPADHQRLAQLREVIANRWPDALPDPAGSQPIFRAGHIITPSPVAISVQTTPAMREAMEMIGHKLAHALYYRETGLIMTRQHRFFSAFMQVQRSGMESLTDFFKRVLPDFRVGARSNIKNYGSRFAYKSGWKPEGELFVFAAQFGYGALCWGMVLGPDMRVDPSHDVLQTMTWLRGGNGAGNFSSSIQKESESTTSAS